MEWINVNKKLPDYKEHVLVFVSDHRNNNVHIAYRCKTDEKGEHYKTVYPISILPQSERSTFTNVDYWMPLPKPPK